MNQEYVAEKTFDKIAYTENPLPIGEYEHCTFVNCDFSNSNLTDIKFMDCTFDNCNLSMAIFMKTALQNAIFKSCKMLGLHFDHCSEFGLSVSFDNCNLNHSSFFQTKLKKTIFKNSKLQEVDFTECDLSSSVFNNCDLMNATFDKTVIEKADFRTAFNYSINPETNRIKKGRFSLSGIAGLLDRYDIEIDSKS